MMREFSIKILGQLYNTILLSRENLSFAPNNKNFPLEGQHFMIEKDIIRTKVVVCKSQIIVKNWLGKKGTGSSASGIEKTIANNGVVTTSLVLVHPV